MTKVLHLFSDLLIVRQSRDPLNDVINFHKWYLRYRFQLHPVFKTLDPSLYAYYSENSVLSKAKFIKKRGTIGSVYIVREQM